MSDSLSLLLYSLHVRLLRPLIKINQSISAIAYTSRRSQCSITASCYSDWHPAMTLKFSEQSNGASACSAWPVASSCPTGDEGLMVGVLAALRSSALSTDERQRRLNAMIVELQQLRRNLEASSSSSSVLSPSRRYCDSPVSQTRLARFVV